jgi:hypothetical protein
MKFKFLRTTQADDKDDLSVLTMQKKRKKSLSLKSVGFWDPQISDHKIHNVMEIIAYINKLNLLFFTLIETSKKRIEM